MCADTSCLALRLQGPVQSWGSESQYNRRTTHLMPSKSAIMGMLCAASGAERGSAKEATLLASFARVRMLSVAVPARTGTEGSRERNAVRMVDFHTVQGTRKAAGGLKDCHITRRHYLNDANFYVFLTGEAILMHSLHEALANPVWGLWLGRKCCIPSAPVLVGLFTTEAEACADLLKAPLDSFTHEREAESFDAGSDSLSDQALSFASSARRFATRRVLRVRALAKAEAQ